MVDVLDQQGLGADPAGVRGHRGAVGPLRFPLGERRGLVGPVGLLRRGVGGVVSSLRLPLSEHGCAVSPTALSHGEKAGDQGDDEQHSGTGEQAPAAAGSDGSAAGAAARRSRLRLVPARRWCRERPARRG